MSVPARPVEYWVSELASLVRDHIRQTSGQIKALEDRITDLEGHAEHGPKGECGVCVPETVGADTYSVERVDPPSSTEPGRAITASTSMECADPFCAGPIYVSNLVVGVGVGKYVHVGCFDTDVWTVAETDTSCSYPTCFDKIRTGDVIVFTGIGHSGHNEWRHRDH